MPGELGNEEESFIVGYYEKRYKPTGEWMVKDYGTVNKWETENPGQNSTKELIKRLQKHDEDPRKGKSNGKSK